MMTLNSNEPPEYPNRVNENPEAVHTDNYAIDKSVQRNQCPSKKRAVLYYEAASIATFQFYKALYDAASTVTYSNDNSNVSGGTLTFTGIIDLDEDDFIRGGSLLVPLTITIREV